MEVVSAETNVDDDWAVVNAIAAGAGDLPVYWGTGYAIERPHVLAVSAHFEVRVYVYPTGERYLGTDQTYHLIRVGA